MTRTLNLASHFDRFFEALPAVDDATRREVFRLRFAVYCEEHGYEAPSAFPDGEEHDAYDNDSTFALIRHRASGRAAGCVRLITNERTADLRFPFEQLCSGQLEPHLRDLLLVSRDRFGEISRLAVHQDFRRRRIDAGDSHRRPRKVWPRRSITAACAAIHWWRWACSCRHRRWR